MNKVCMTGRLTKDPSISTSQKTNANGEPVIIARFNVAIDRRFKREGDDQTADFIPVVCFGSSAKFAEKYLKQGTKVEVTGRLQSGRYTNKDGNTVFTIDVVGEEVGFAESKKASEGSSAASAAPAAPAEDAGDEFINVPEGFDEELPFN